MKMKRVFFSLLLLVPLVLQAQTTLPAADTGQTRDSVILQRTLYFNYNVARWITPSEYYKMEVFLKSVEKYPETKIRIVGWSDKNGSDELNLEFSRIRAQSMKRYLVSQGIAAERITIKGEGADKQATSDAKARRVDMTQVIELIITDAPVSTPTVVEQLQEQPKQVEVVQQQPEPIKEQEPQPTVTPEVVKEEITSVRKPLFALKTNLLYDAAMIPNLEIEIPIGKRWSINAEYQIAWWDKSDNSFCWRINAGGVEARYWFGDRNKHKQLNGWFAGVFVNGGTYDFQVKKDNGYQGDFIVPGISGGYATPIARNLNLEFSLGVGYMISNYHHYDVISRELVDYGQTKQYRSIFPAKAKISLVWMINRNVKKGGK